MCWSLNVHFPFPNHCLRSLNVHFPFPNHCVRSLNVHFPFSNYSLRFNVHFPSLTDSPRSLNVHFSFPNHCLRSLNAHLLSSTLHLSNPNPITKVSIFTALIPDSCCPTCKDILITNGILPSWFFKRVGRTSQTLIILNRPNIFRHASLYNINTRNPNPHKPQSPVRPWIL